METKNIFMIPITKICPFPSDSRLRHFVRHGQPPTMSNADAISILKNIETDIYGRIAISKAIDALRSPWVKTSDRLPTEADAGVDEEIVTIYDDGDTRMMGVDHWKCVALVPERFPYWLPVPKLPEVEE